MQSTRLAGRSILIVEDEPLIALDIEQTFAKAGAIVFPARKLSDAHHLVEQNRLAAAVLDFRLGDGDAQVLCARLVARGGPHRHACRAPGHGRHKRVRVEFVDARSGTLQRVWSLLRQADRSHYGGLH
jgi:DNA-binding NtrC family response regulator